MVTTYNGATKFFNENDGNLFKNAKGYIENERVLIEKERNFIENRRI